MARNCFEYEVIAGIEIEPSDPCKARPTLVNQGFATGCRAQQSTFSRSRRPPTILRSAPRLHQIQDGGDHRQPAEGGDQDQDGVEQAAPAQVHARVDHPAGEVTDAE